MISVYFLKITAGVSVVKSAPFAFCCFFSFSAVSGIATLLLLLYITELETVNERMRVQNMKKQILFGFAVIFVLLFAVGCSYGVALENREKLKQVRVGMTKAQVRELMGAPLENEKYHTPDIWFYYTDPKWYDGVFTRDECTPFLFDEAGKLKGFGYEFYKRELNSDPWRRRQLDQQL